MHPHHEHPTAIRPASPATDHLRRQTFGAFARWCAENGESALPASPATLAAYVGARHHGGRLTSLRLMVLEAAVRAIHADYGLTAPRITRAMVEPLLGGGPRDRRLRYPSERAIRRIAHHRDLR